MMSPAGIYIRYSTRRYVTLSALRFKLTGGPEEITEGSDEITELAEIYTEFQPGGPNP